MYTNTYPSSSLISWAMREKVGTLPMSGGCCTVNIAVNVLYTVSSIKQTVCQNYFLSAEIILLNIMVYLLLGTWRQDAVRFTTHLMQV